MTDYNQLKLQAHALLERHDCGGKQKDVENCCACALNSTTKANHYRPNYSGWLRVYIQANRSISPIAYFYELEHTDNQPYLNAIKDDIKHFGLILSNSIT